MQNLTNDPRWVENRKKLEELVCKENLVSSEIIFPNKYHDVEEEFPKFKDIQLILETYQTDPKCSSITKCVIKQNEVIMAEVIRNYHSFPFSLFTHANGKRYLTCGMDYQGYTIVDIDTGTIINYIPPEAKYGAGLCITEFQGYDEFTNTLTVEACVWGGEDYTVMYDISNPEEMPWVIKYRAKVYPDDTIDENDDEE